MAEPSEKRYLNYEGAKRLYDALKQELMMKLDSEDLDKAVAALNEAISTQDIAELNQAETIIIYGGSASEVL